MPPKWGKSLMNAKQKNEQQNRAHYKDIVKEATEQHIAYVEKEKSLKSLWDASNLDEFLSNAAEKADGFAAKKDVRVVVSGQVHLVKNNKIIPLSDQRDWIKLSEVLTIPKRPAWTYDMSGEEIERREKQSFLEWRRSLAQLEEAHQAVLTPYEKNLEVWRQLWRVVERSSIVLYIVDARNPLTFRCRDFEQYVLSLSQSNERPSEKSATASSSGQKKYPILLLNKADLLTENQRIVWANYFTKMGIPFYFFAARETKQPSTENPKSEKSKSGDLSSDEEGEEEEEEGSTIDSSEDETIKKIQKKEENAHRQNPERRKRRIRGGPTRVANIHQLVQEEKEERKNKMKLKEEELSGVQKKAQAPATQTEEERDARLKERTQPLSASHVLTPVDIVDEMVTLREKFQLGGPDGQPVMIGLVGYPNVGKSSTINAIFGQKKVVVSATPGKTKHFQTLELPEERRVVLCDCPGLVFPSFAATRETMICDGILPIDVVKDFTTPVALITQRIPKTVLEAYFNADLSAENDVDESYDLAERVMNIVARMRGYMTDHNKPCKSRVAKEVLKRYVDGDLIYVHPPPGSEDVRAAILEQARQSMPTSGLPVEHKAEVEKEEEEEGEWEDISSAEEARRISDDDEDEDEAEIMKKKIQSNPGFFAQQQHKHRHSAQPTTTNSNANPLDCFENDELFNMERNQEAIQLIQQLQLQRKNQRKQHKKKVNHQLEPDLTTRVNKSGEKEANIDSDDGIVIAMPHPDDAEFLREKAEKKKTKRQARREEKRGISARQKCIETKFE